MATVLDRRYQEALARLRLTAAGGVERAWLSLPSYDRADVATFVNRAVPIVGAAQRNAVSLTGAYLSRSLKSRVVALDLAATTGAAVRNGATPADVYGRAFVTVWRALGAGSRFEDAVASGLARATATAQTDVALSSRAAAVEYASRDSRITGWRRVADSGACPLCAAASDQTYHSDDVMPIHDRCGCTVEPIVGEATTPSGPPAGVAIHEHGELGPVLAKEGDDFTGPDDLS